MLSTPLLSPYLQSRRFQAVKPFLIGDVLDLGCARQKYGSLVGARTNLLRPKG
jgi:hypothetical protein